MREPIDFVITWVDGTDQDWLAERASYSVPRGADVAPERFRSMGDTLRYWFRGVETFCPWVRKVHLVTWGHVPEWLDTSAPKLHVVRHEDFIPERYLPVFNSNAIEIHFHRIPGLSEQFVSFNDDVYIVRALEPEDFFRDGLPLDMLAVQPVIANPSNPVMSHIYLNNSLLLSKHFSKRAVAKERPGSLFHVGYPPLYFFYNALEMLYPQMTGFYTAHGLASMRKETYRILWDQEREECELTASHRFRDIDDISIYAFQEWQKLSGAFVPANITRRLGYYDIARDLDELVCDLRLRKKAIVCVNDAVCDDFAERCALVESQLALLLPNASRYELS